jgi:uncharacterized protein (TIGR00266 family)
MEFNIEGQPDYALLNVDIPRDQALMVEASSMASMDTNLEMKATFKGGLKRFLSRESIFINRFTAKGALGQISIAPGLPGDISHYNIKSGENFFLTASSFLACEESVQRDTKWQGFKKGFFSGESFFLIKCSGQGDVWFNCFGAMFEIDVIDEYIIDTGHIVAFTEGLDYSISKIGGYKSLFFSGEGFVARFKGQGKIWVQTKGPMAFVNWADQFRIVQRNNN